MDLDDIIREAGTGKQLSTALLHDADLRPAVIFERNGRRIVTAD